MIFQKVVGFFLLVDRRGNINTWAGVFFTTVPPGKPTGEFGWF